MSGARLRVVDRQAYASAAEFAYATLRGEIMDGHLPAGQRMREQELSERLRISRTPVREALSRLVSDGLVAEKLAPDDPMQQQRHNRAFHGALLAASHNRFLVKSLQVLHDALALLGPTTLMRQGRREEAQAEHQRILDAIEKRDCARAEQEMRAHVRHGAEVRQAMRAVAGRD